MFRAAVCDDVQAMCTDIEQIILDYQKYCAEKIEVLIFLSGEELYRVMKEGQAFDLIFLDIELYKLSGIDVAKQIREEFNDNITQIVYISAKKDYVFDLFKSRPLNFLVKPISREKIIDELRLAMKLHLNNNLLFEFSYKYTTYRIPYKKIIYFASNDRKIHIITEDREYEFYGKLSELEKQVQELDFIQIHKSYLVNYQYIAEINYENIKLVNGEELNISKAYRNDVRYSLIMRRKEPRK